MLSCILNFQELSYHCVRIVSYTYSVLVLPKYFIKSFLINKNHCSIKWYTFRYIKNLIVSENKYAEAYR